MGPVSHLRALRRARRGYKALRQATDRDLFLFADDPAEIRPKYRPHVDRLFWEAENALTHFRAAATIDSFYASDAREARRLRMTLTADKLYLAGEAAAAERMYSDAEAVPAEISWQPIAHFESLAKDRQQRAREWRQARDAPPPPPPVKRRWSAEFGPERPSDIQQDLWDELYGERYSDTDW